MTDDWYRNEKWNARIEEKFLKRLGRARSQRDQYLAIQALSLVRKHPHVALRLVEMYFETRSIRFHDLRALLAKAEALQSLDLIEEAIKAYREILRLEEESPNQLTSACFAYPYLVATKKVDSEYEHAIRVLDQCKNQIAFPVEGFEWFASKALIQSDSDLASQALEYADLNESQFRYHRKLGLVGKEHARTIKKLRQIST